MERVSRHPLIDQMAAAADPLRGRLLLVLDGQELTVSELCDILQLPQSTVSRHLKTLLDSRWIVSRREGTSRYYGLDTADLSPAARRVWLALRDELAGTAAAEQDDRRLKRVLAGRRTASSVNDSKPTARSTIAQAIRYSTENLPSSAVRGARLTRYISAPIGVKQRTDSTSAGRMSCSTHSRIAASIARCVVKQAEYFFSATPGSISACGAPSSSN